MIAVVLAFGETGYAEVVFMADAAGATYPDLSQSSDDARQTSGTRSELTVEVMSDEQTSHTYFTPPSVPRDAVFFLIRPIASLSPTQVGVQVSPGAAGGDTSGR